MGSGALLDPDAIELLAKALRNRAGQQELAYAVGSAVRDAGTSAFDTAEGCAPGLSRIAPWQGLTRGESIA